MKIVKEISKFEIICHTKKFNKDILDLHWHERYELCQVLNNGCGFIVDGQMISAEVGDIIAINENVVHQFIINSNDTYIRICQLPLKLVLNFKNRVMPLATHIKIEDIKAVSGLEERINMLFAIMEQEKAEQSTANNPFIQSLASSLYFLLERHFSIADGSFSQDKERKDFYKIIEYVNEHFREDITVELVAKQLYFTRGKVTSLFKKYAGEGLNEYTNKLRIKRANSLLLSGMSITEAALESGFQSIRTFNNVYKQIMGITPSEYVKENES